MCVLPANRGLSKKTTPTNLRLSSCSFRHPELHTYHLIVWESGSDPNRPYGAAHCKPPPISSLGARVGMHQEPFLFFFSNLLLML